MNSPCFVLQPLVRVITVEAPPRGQSMSQKSALAKMASNGDINSLSKEAYPGDGGDFSSLRSISPEEKDSIGRPEIHSRPRRASIAPSEKTIRELLDRDEAEDDQETIPDDQKTFTIVSPDEKRDFGEDVSSVGSKSGDQLSDYMDDRNARSIFGNDYDEKALHVRRRSNTSSFSYSHQVAEEEVE